jgi:hypothetical protein
MNLEDFEGILRDWREMDTSLAEKWDDDFLLNCISGLPIPNGWGLIAELMKRYAKEKGL